MTSENPIARFLRLKNGDDIISEVVEIQEDDEHFYMLINPLKAVYMPSSTGYLSIAFMPWVFPRICDKQEFTIDYDDVLLVTDVSGKMNDYYWDSIDTYINENKEEAKQKVDKESEEEYMEEIAKLMQTIKDKRTMH